MDYSGRQVVVTGGTGALGRAVVDALLAAGAACHVPCRTAAEAEATPRRAGLTLREAGDLSDAAVAAAFYRQVPGLWASIHIAGGFAMGRLAETEPALLRGQVEANLMSCLMCCREAVAAMAGKGGRIVNVAARPALEPRQGGGMVAYTASKAAVAALTVALAEEVAREGILVNAVAPSIIDTPANRSAMPKADHAAWPKPDEIAATILFLASVDNRVTRGAIVPVYGQS